MKVLLVYPEFPDTYWSFRHVLSLAGKRSAFPPLGLLTISAMFPETWERRLVDMNVGTLRDADIAWADIVLVSAMIVQKESLEDVVRRAKALGKTVAVGGPYVSTGAQSVAGADHIFVGEAEATVPEFLDDLARGCPKPLYRPSQRPGLDETPVADFGLMDLGAYSAMSIQYSRGCPFQCEFCDIIEIYGRVPRTKSNAQVLAELDALFGAGWRGLVFIVDDNFIGNRKNVKRLLPELAAWNDARNRPFSFATEASLNLADDDEMLALMRRAGFYRVFLGIETPVEESLHETLKGQNTKRDLIASVRKIQGYGMEVMGGFIVGFDSDPDDIFDRQVDFIRESAIPMAMVGLLSALPGTQLWRRLEREGRLVADSTGNNTDGTLNFVPRMDAARLVEGYKRILRTIYSPAEYYQRVLGALSRIGAGAPVIRSAGIGANIAAFVRVTVALGVRDGARMEFWRFLRRVVLHHRQKFSHAVTLAAMGYHFRKHTDTCCGE